MPSIFSRIISGEIPAYKIFENENFLAFLDINPITEGHTLVIPKKEIDYIFDLPDELLMNMMIFAKKVGKNIEKAIPCKRIGIMVCGLEIPHAHIHLVPINDIKTLHFALAKPASKEDLMRVAEKIRKEFI